MAGRYLGDGKSFEKIGAPHKYKVGDVIFYSVGNHTGSGEAMFLGRLKDRQRILPSSMESRCTRFGRVTVPLWAGHFLLRGRVGGAHTLNPSRARWSRSSSFGGPPRARASARAVSVIRS